MLAHRARRRRPRWPVAETVAVAGTNRLFAHAPRAPQRFADQHVARLDHHHDAVALGEREVGDRFFGDARGDHIAAADVDLDRAVDRAVRDRDDGAGDLVARAQLHQVPRFGRRAKKLQYDPFVRSGGKPREDGGGAIAPPPLAQKSAPTLRPTVRGLITVS